MRIVSQRSSKRADHAELVAHLGAAEHADERVPGRLEQAAEHLDLAGEQPTGGARQHAWRPDDRRVGAVRSAERVVDVIVAERGEARANSFVAGLFARIEAQVLEQQHVTGAELRHQFCRCGAGHVGRQRHVGAEHSGQPGRDGCQRVLGVRARPSVVRGANTARRSGRVRRGTTRSWERGSDAQVVADPRWPVAAVERHVEVGAHQYACRPSADPRVVAGHLDTAPGPARTRAHFSPMNSTRSTRRFE